MCLNKSCRFFSPKTCKKLMKLNEMNGILLIRLTESSVDVCRKAFFYEIGQFRLIIRLIWVNQGHKRLFGQNFWDDIMKFFISMLISFFLLSKMIKHISLFSFWNNFEYSICCLCIINQQDKIAYWVCKQSVSFKSKHSNKKKTGFYFFFW